MTTTQTTPIVPAFDDVETDRQLAIICSKENLDMAYPGLVLANAALGEGVETHLFFTFWGCRTSPGCAASSAPLFGPRQS